jgi:dedicator of cytokinesis protein 3
VPDVRPARQDKKRMSLSFFGIGAPTGDEDSKHSEKERKQEKTAAEDSADTASTSASSRSRSKDRSRNRLSRSLVSPASPVPEALPHFPSQLTSSQNSLAKVRSRASSRGQSVDGRPQTSKSVKSERFEVQSRSSSVKKRLSNFYIGKKSSKASVRGRVDDTLEEE